MLLVAVRKFRPDRWADPSKKYYAVKGAICARDKKKLRNQPAKIPLLPTPFLIIITIYPCLAKEISYLNEVHGHLHDTLKRMSRM